MGRLFLRVCEFFCVRKKIWQWWLVDFDGVEPPKSMHFHRRDADENAWGKNKSFSPTPLLALLTRITRLRRESRHFVPSAFGDQKTFSEEKVFWIFKKTFFAAR